MGTINAATSTFAIAAVADAVGVDPWWLAAGGGVAAGAALVAAARQGLSRASGAYRACCLAAAGSWATWATATSPWHTNPVAALAAGAVGAGLLAPGLARHERTVAEQTQRAEALASRRGAAADWAARIDRVCHLRGTRIVGLVEWDWKVDGQPTGFSLDVDLPRVGWRRVEQFAGDLADDAELPNGCGVEVKPGVHRGACVLHVATINALAAEIPYPDDYSPLSCLNPLQLGMKRTGAPAGVDTRTATTLIIGQTGSGKTNVMQVLNAGLARSVDAIIWHIDLNGGGLALPWVLPWWENPDQVPNPAVDWVAADGDEALLVATTALKISRQRRTIYQPLMRQVNDDKVPVSPNVPLIVVVVDEIANIMGENSEHPRVRDALNALQNEGRAGAGREVLGGLRATTEIIGSANVRKQSSQRVGMRVQDIEELQFLFGNSKGVSTEEMIDAGFGYLGIGQLPPDLFRAQRLRPNQIEEIARAVGGIRPALDEPSAQIAGEAYARRWERAGWIAAATGGVRPTVALTPPAGDRAELPAGGSLGDAMQGLDEAREALRRAKPDGEPTADTGDGDIGARFDDVMAGWDLPAPDRIRPAGPAPAEPAKHARDRMLELLRDAGQAGSGPKALSDQLRAEGYSTSRQTAQVWLGEAHAARAAWKRPGGIYIHADHPRPDDAQ